MTDPILVVDDDATVRTVAVLQLNKLGFPSETAENGLEAVQCVLKRKYLLVLMDLQMPEMDGFKATEAIRAYEKANNLHETPIVAFTASGKGNRENCLAVGMNDYSLKPNSLSSLKEIVDKWVPENRSK